jgi:hypothetical protein
MNLAGTIDGVGRRVPKPKHRHQRDEGLPRASAGQESQRCVASECYVRGCAIRRKVTTLEAEPGECRAGSKIEPPTLGGKAQVGPEEHRPADPAHLVSCERLTAFGNPGRRQIDAQALDSRIEGHTEPGGGSELRASLCAADGCARSQVVRPCWLFLSCPTLVTRGGGTATGAADGRGAGSTGWAASGATTASVPADAGFPALVGVAAPVGRATTYSGCWSDSQVAKTTATVWLSTAQSSFASKRRSPSDVPSAPVSVRSSHAPSRLRVACSSGACSSESSKIFCRSAETRADRGK